MHHSELIIIVFSVDVPTLENKDLALLTALLGLLMDIPVNEMFPKNPTQSKAPLFMPVQASGCGRKDVWT